MGARKDEDCPSQEERRWMMKARLEKPEGFPGDAALGKSARFICELGKLRERVLVGGSHPRQGGEVVLHGALHGNCQSRGGRSGGRIKA